VAESERQKLRHFLLIEDTKGRRVVSLDAATYTLGRDLTNSIVIYAREVSRQHAILLRIPTPGATNFLFRIIDGNLQGKRSTNGLIVNGKRCFSHDLKQGDLIQFGGASTIRYNVTSNVTDTEFARFCESADVMSLSSAAGGPLQTVILEPDSANNEAAIIRLASIPELNPNPIVEIDLSGNITYLNPAAIKKFPNLRTARMQHELLMGLPLLVHDSTEEIIVREVTIGQDVFEQSVHYISESDLIRSYIADITERKRSEREIQQRDRLLQAVAEATNYLLTNPEFEIAIIDALAILGTAATVDRVYIYQHYIEPTTGKIARKLRFEWRKTASLPGVTITPQDQAYATSGLTRWYDNFVIGKAISGLTRELPLREQEVLRRDRVLSVLLEPILIDDLCWGFIGFDDCRSERQWSKSESSILATMAASISGAIQRQKIEENIRHQAVHDALTGLPNRILFTDRLHKAIAAREHESELIAVMFLDLDRFKMVNDTLGHTSGDQLLCRVAERLTHCVEEKDSIARFGNDEFVFSFSQLDSVREAVKVAQRILDALKNPFYVSNQELYVTGSLGIALYPHDGADAESLIKNSDTALYRAKAGGRSNVEFYAATMSAEAAELFTVEKHLYRALEREEFVIHYQPQINLSTWEIVGMEALLRWNSPELGKLSPKTFIPLIEDNGLIIPIGEWVLKTACAQNKAWQEAGLPPLTTSVNLSAVQFQQPNLVERITQILEDTGLAPQFLDLEITESIAIQDADFTCAMMRELHAKGICLSMDDFGTGYSSLSYLKQFPLDTLKIDQSFVKDVTASAMQAEIVTIVISLARALQMNVIVEGVETMEQLSFLRSRHCQAVQGYLISKPMPAEEATAFLTTHWFQKRKQLLHPELDLSPHRHLS
jgi:diguanylate cyclase (GGDEF)-like protein